RPYFSGLHRLVASKENAVGDVAGFHADGDGHVLLGTIRTAARSGATGACLRHDAPLPNTGRLRRLAVGIVVYTLVHRRLCTPDAGFSGFFYPDLLLEKKPFPNSRSPQADSGVGGIR